MLDLSPIQAPLVGATFCSYVGCADVTNEDEIVDAVWRSPPRR